MSRVDFGADVLVREGFRRWRGRRVGLIANPTSVDRRLIHLADLIHAAAEVEIAALFGPEHGARGDAQDMIGVAGEFDRETGAPVHSLYGSEPSSLTPTAGQLDGIDLLVFDVQDVGSRYYTFAATMAYAMRAAAENGIGFAVLDRPNPIGGLLVEGPGITEGHASFVGFHDMPIRHGLTVGEIALLVKSEWNLDVDLEVVPCQGWTRAQDWRAVDRAWISPSPNMPTPDTALVYPGGCLVEGTNLSEGRGTTRPFENWGAPWLDARELTQAATALLESAGCATGAIFRSNGFRPTFHKWAARLCGGVQPHVVDPSAFRPVAVYTAFLAAAARLGEGDFAWRTEAYEFVSDPIAVDLLYGSGRERDWMDAGLDGPGLRTLVEELWRKDEDAFRERREPFLLYGDR